MSSYTPHPDLEDRINILVEERNRKERIEQRMTYLDHILPTLQRELQILSSILSKEERDYLQVRRKSVYKLFASLYINYEKLIDKEYQEYVIAYATYYDQLNRIDLLEKEQEILRQTYSGLFNVEAKLEALLLEKENILRALNPDFTARFNEYDRRIKARESFITELEQAIRAGEIAFAKIKRLYGALQDLISYIKSYDFMSTMSYKMRGQLRSLHQSVTPVVESLDIYSVELSDVSKRYRIQYQDEMYDFQRFLSHLAHRLIVDIFQRKELNGTRHLLEQLLQETDTLQQTLQHEIMQTQQLIAQDKEALKNIATEF